VEHSKKQQVVSNVELAPTKIKLAKRRASHAYQENFKTRQVKIHAFSVLPDGIPTAPSTKSVFPAKSDNTRHATVRPSVSIVSPAFPTTSAVSLPAKNAKQDIFQSFLDKSSVCPLRLVKS
jgi:hypothetical protein